VGGGSEARSDDGFGRGAVELTALGFVRRAAAGRQCADRAGARRICAGEFLPGKKRATFGATGVASKNFAALAECAKGQSATVSMGPARACEAAIKKAVRVGSFLQA